MATKFYIGTDGGDGVISPPTTWRGSWDSTGLALNRMFDPIQIRGGPASRNAAETSATNPFRVAVYRFVSRPLQAQTIAGTLDWIIGCSESNAAADFYWKVYAYIRVGVTDTVRAVLLDYEDATEEWPVTSTGTAAPAAMPALTSGAAQDGDTLVIELGYISRNSVTTSRTGNIRVGCMDAPESFTPQADLTVGSTSTSTLAGTITFSQTLLFVPIANDHFVNATVLTGSLVDVLNLTEATWDGDEPEPCSGSNINTHARYASVWYTWTCPVNQNATVSADIVGGASTFDTVLMVMTGTPGSFVTVDCRSENDPSFESITFAATMGVTYTILVMTVYYGGGQLTFTFTPDVEPVGDETIIPARYDGDFTFDQHTAMGWVKLQTDVATRHFYYVGEGVTPFVPGNRYVWIGTDADGETLTLNVYDGTTLTVVAGPVLAMDTWVHWTYTHDNDDHTVYLAVEGGAGSSIAIGPSTIPVGMPPPDSGFVYGAALTQIPKAFKVWSTLLDLAAIDLETEHYNGVTYAGNWNVTQFRTDTIDAFGGWTDYSGYDHRLDNVIVGGGTGWEIIRGPVLSTCPARPWFDDFDSYQPGAPVGPYFPGVVDQAVAYQYATQQTFSADILAGVGRLGTQAFDSIQAGASIWFEHDAYTGRCGSVSCWSKKVTSGSYGSNPHGVGVSIQSATVDAGASPPVPGVFGFLNDVSGGPTADLTFFNLWDATSDVVPGVYLDDVYQFFELFFQLSTVDDAQTDVNADGLVQIYVDGVLVYERSDLKLTVDNSGWPLDLNTWDTANFVWGGYLDDVSIGINCPLAILRVVKVTDPSDAPQSFDFQTAGGLSPSTFALTDGQVEDFLGLPQGTYGVQETPVDGWSTVIDVSNGDPPDAIALEPGDDVTVTVTNTQAPPCPGLVVGDRQDGLPYVPPFVNR